MASTSLLLIIFLLRLTAATIKAAAPSAHEVTVKVNVSAVSAEDIRRVSSFV